MPRSRQTDFEQVLPGQAVVGFLTSLRAAPAGVTPGRLN
jgi:hypothetical protein